MLIYNDGSKYEGEFFENKIDGRGVLSKTDGGEIKGIWKEGNLIEEENYNMNNEENNNINNGKDVIEEKMNSLNMLV